MKNKLFSPAGAPYWVERAITELVGIGSDGSSDWVQLQDIAEQVRQYGRQYPGQLGRRKAEKIVASISGNGSALLNQDRGLGNKYTIREEDKSRGRNKRLVAVRLAGFKLPIGRAGGVPTSVRESLVEKACVMCSACGTEIDHKSGTKERLDDPTALHHYQPMCSSCNKAKREFCKRCKATNRRPAAPAGFAVKYTWGGVTLQRDSAEGGCKGCYWFDPVDFRKKNQN